MTVRELIRVLTKCDDIDTHITIDGNLIIAFDTEHYELIAQQNPANPNANLIEALKQIKGDRSIRQWGIDTGISASYLAALFKGKYEPSAKILAKITDGKSKPKANISLHDLVECIRRE